MRFQFIDAQHVKGEVPVMCAVLDGSRSGCYAGRTRGVSARELADASLV